MDTYSINNCANKEDFLREGFTYCGFNVLRRYTNLYKKLITMKITVDFTKEDTPSYVEVIDATSQQPYPMNCEYGINEVREKVKQRYEKEIKTLISKGLLKKEKNRDEKNSKIRKG